MTPYRLLVALACSSAPLFCSASIPLAVKRGQKTVNPKTLPFVCIELTLDKIALPIEKIEFENLDTHRTETANLAKSFNSEHPDYLTAVIPGQCTLSLAILRLDPGRYQIKSIEYDVRVANGAAWIDLDLTKSGRFEFFVMPSVVNYVGGLEISANWQEMPLLRAGDASRDFSYRIGITKSQQRDVKWADDVVPCLKSLPSVASSITRL